MVFVTAKLNLLVDYLSAFGKVSEPSLFSAKKVARSKLTLRNARRPSEIYDERHLKTHL